MTRLPSSNRPVAGRQPRNRRLPAHERRDQILDAALHEFSEKGFSAGRMDDIAARAGLSKGGLYAHFESKDAVVQALMQRMLLPDMLLDARPPDGSLPTGASSQAKALEIMVDDFLERTYARLEDERFTRTLHLLIAEGSRIPAVIERWRANHLQVLRGQQDAVRRAVETGAVRDSALTDMVQLIHAPILLAAVLGMLQDDAYMRGVIPKLRAAHRRLLLDLLPPESA